MSIKEIQTILTQIGVDIGKVDGLTGRKTVDGIKEFQKIFGLQVDGIVGKNTIDVLQKAKKITHFKLKEFGCRHCGQVKLDINLLLKLEELRELTGALIINSGYRCPTHNKNVGGASRSQHLKGTAADLRGVNMKPNQVHRHADKIFSNGGVGKYKTFTHVDVRGTRSRWNG